MPVSVLHGGALGVPKTYARVGLAFAVGNRLRNDEVQLLSRGFESHSIPFKDIPAVW